MRNIAWLLLVVLGCGGNTALAAATASVDRTRIAQSESLELRIRVEGAGSVAEPELGPLRRDFEVVSSSRNARISLINGRSESWTEWVIGLLARRTGELEIPSLLVDGQHTAPLRIVVSAEEDPGASAGRELVLEVIPESNAVHVQQQLLLTVRVLHAINLNRGASLEEPELPGAVLRKLDENSYEKTIGGRRYGVFERRYAVFPQTAGELRIPPLEFSANVGGGSWFDQFGARGRELRLRSAEQVIAVRGAQDAVTPWLPARMLTLVETWDRSPTQLRVGESATRTLTLTAGGLTAAQLPPLETAAVDGLRFYPDQPEITDEAGADGITGTRVERSAVIPLRQGELELPPIRLRWWDTVNGRFTEAMVPGRSVRVLPGNAAAAATTDAVADPSTAVAAAPPTTLANPVGQSGGSRAAYPWMLACAALALCTLVATMRWWQLARQHAAVPPRAASAESREPQLFSALASACRANDAAEAERLLPQWARALLPAAPPRTLADFARRAADAEFDAALQALLASRYGSGPDRWIGSSMAVVLRRLRGALPRARLNHATSPLPPLYAAAPEGGIRS
jgi:hypothetical protein